MISVVERVRINTMIRQLSISTGKKIQKEANLPMIKLMRINWKTTQIEGGYMWSNQFAGKFFLLSLMLAFVFWGCEKDTTSPSPNELQLSQASSDGLVSSWQTIHSLNSVGDVQGILDGNVEVNTSEIGGLNSIDQIQHEYGKLQRGLETVLTGPIPDGIQTEDSLIWFIDWTDPISGISVRKALYYDSVLGIARYYEAIYHFPAQLRITYDSAEVKVNLNFTLHNSSDDKFLSLTKLSLFEEDFFVQKIEAGATATDYDQNNQVTGAVAVNHVWYGEQTALAQLLQNLEINPDQSGHIDERLDYRDNTYLSKEVNFYADFTGDFAENWRDGTQVTGTFDRLEDDNHASITRFIDFPAIYLLDKIEQAADVTLNPADSSSHWSLNEKIYFAGGNIDTSELIVDEYFEAGFKKTHLQGVRSNGSQADLLITHYPEYQDIEGWTIGTEGYYSLVHAILYSDGSGELWLTVYLNKQAYLNGDPPLANIYIHFNPDGSGEGQITETDKSYNVKVNQNGEMQIQDEEGNRKVLSGF